MATTIGNCEIDANDLKIGSLYVSVKIKHLRVYKVKVFLCKIFLFFIKKLNLYSEIILKQEDSE